MLDCRWLPRSAQRNRSPPSQLQLHVPQASSFRKPKIAISSLDDPGVTRDDIPFQEGILIIISNSVSKLQTKGHERTESMARSDRARERLTALDRERKEYDRRSTSRIEAALLVLALATNESYLL